MDGLVRDVEAIVREARHVFGEYPPFEGNTYTFIADYLPWANGDGMEHRNSTILTSSSSIQADRLDLLDTIAHEFFHTWNVERIRPKSLEPFNFEEANMSGELWLAEGFTSYYGPLTLKRAGLHEPARRSLRDDGRGDREDRHEPCPPDPIGGRDEPAGAVRRCRDVDRPDELREHLHLLLHVGHGARCRPRSHAARSQDGKVTLDDFMRALWSRFGRPGIDVPGYVKTPYTIDDLKDRARRPSPAMRSLPKTSSLATSKGTRFPTTRGSSGEQAFW